MFDELRAKLESLGEPTLTRIQEYREQRDFTIGMDYRAALIRS
jgi:DNA uptake protein ComE-like DNA-binding protein